MIDLRSVIASLGGTALTVDRRPAGSWDMALGVFQSATSVPTLIGICSIQPGVDRGVVLPEGVCADDTVTVFAPAALIGANDPDGAQADRFNHRGHRFEVFELRNWSAGGQGLFYKAYCKRVKEVAP